MEQANQEVEGAKQVCNQYSAVLDATYTTMLEIFRCTESSLKVETIKEKVPTWMHGLIIAVTKINGCVQHNLKRYVAHTSVLSLSDLITDNTRKQQLFCQTCDIY